MQLTLLVKFSSPFSGTFFQISEQVVSSNRREVFVPFLGNLFSKYGQSRMTRAERQSFRPLSREPFFKWCFEYKDMLSYVFVPFLGNLFSKHRQ